MGKIIHAHAVELTAFVRNWPAFRDLPTRMTRTGNSRATSLSTRTGRMTVDLKLRSPVTKMIVIGAVR